MQLSLLSTPTNFTAFRQKQIQLTESILSSVLADYSPPFLDFAINTLKEEPVRAAFEQWFLELLSPSLLNDSQPSSQCYKNLFLASLRSVDLFLDHFNAAISFHGARYQELDPLNPQAEWLEKKLVLHMNQLASQEGLPNLVPDDFDAASLERRLNERFVSLLLECFPQAFKNQQKKHAFLTLLTASLIRRVADQLFTPKMMMLLLDRLLHASFFLDTTLIATSGNKKELTIEDEHFNQELGSITSRLARHLIKIGAEDESPFLQFIYNQAINLVMFFYRHKLSSLMQKGINQSLQLNPVLTPLVVLEQLLYVSRSSQQIPVLANPQTQLIHKRVERVFKNNLLFENLNGKLMRQPHAWRWLIKDSSLLKRLCQNLGNTSYFFLQRPLLLKTLLSYLLESIKKELIHQAEDSSYVKNSE